MAWEPTDCLCCNYPDPVTFRLRRQAAIEAWRIMRSQLVSTELRIDGGSYPSLCFQGEIAEVKYFKPFEVAQEMTKSS
ncbi:hypothetical protein HJFPF1_08806 [Paramyrothecium foliicola]|nr:hypothetical protein HJFPF1_08806 [Paramyrothecium foliicola]